MITCKDTGEQVLTYKEYLKTKHWLKLKALYSYQYEIKRCRLCGSERRLNIHHVTYENLGNETFKDLIYLCQPCHYKIHEEFGTADTKMLKRLPEQGVKRVVKAKKPKKNKKQKDCKSCIDYHKGKCILGKDAKGKGCSKHKSKTKKK